MILSVLDLRSNKLNGTIPATSAKGNYLRSLNLNDNQLEGSLPRSLINCRRLEVLDLGNKISGTFPHWLESLPELRVLVLRSNKFHGAIASPKTKFSFPNLRIIDLSHNEFMVFCQQNISIISKPWWAWMQIKSLPIIIDHSASLEEE